MNASLAQGFSCVQKPFARLTLKGFQMNTVHMRMKLIRNSFNFFLFFIFLSHCEQEKRSPSSSLWCCFLSRTWFLFCTYDFPQSGQRCRSTGTVFAEYKSSMNGPLFPLPSRQKHPLHSPQSLQTSPSVIRNPQTS